MLSLFLAITVATGGTGVDLEVDPELPFSAEELERAVALRVEPRDEREPEPISVSRSGADAARIQHRAVTKTVPLLGARGRHAARRVALAISDMLRAGITVPESPKPRAQASKEKPVALKPQAEPPPVVVEREPEDESGSSVADLYLMLGGGVGAPVDRGALFASLEGSLRLLGPLRGVVALGGSQLLAPTLEQGELSFYALSFKAGLGLSLLESVPLELRLTSSVSPYFLSGQTSGASISKNGALAAVGASGVVRFPLAEPVSLALSAGADLNLVRHEFRIHDTVAFATDRVAFWAAAGCSVEVW